MLQGSPFAGKVALVTGGSRGIGAAISRKLSSLGAETYINHVERDAPASELVDELRAQGAVAHVLKADVADPDRVSWMMEEIRRRSGRLDVLVHNAAVAVYRPVTEGSVAHWDFSLNTNARSMILLAQAARPLMAGRGARLIALSNRSAVKHAPGSGLIGAAKAALEAFVRSLSVELAGDGIVVNCVRPGTVATQGVRVLPDSVKKLENEEATSPWHRVTTPEDVANAIALLCLDEAAWICGQTLVVDGGWSVWR